MNDAALKPRVLWLHGNAASGKSILTSFIINHITGLGAPCHYFFVRFASEEKRNPSMLLRSLACQLANSEPAYAAMLRQLHAAGTNLSTAEYRTVWQWLFREALFRLHHLDKPLFLIIDGLDEAHKPGSFVRLLEDLRLTTLPIRFMVVSRDTYEISSAFQKVAGEVDVEKVLVEGNAADLRAFIDQELDLGSDAGYREHIAARLLDRAKGNFLWLHLAVQQINSCHTTPDVDRTLTGLLPGMEALFDRMAQSVNAAAATSLSNRQLGRTLLGWVACAQRPLSTEELNDAPEIEDSGVFSLHRSIADLCGGFVTVDSEGKVSLIHETAREYLTQGTGLGRPLTIDIQSANGMILKRCILRLTDPALRSQVSRGHAPALLDYAATMWHHHLVHSSVAAEPEMLELVVAFLKSIHVLTWVYVISKSARLRNLAAASRALGTLSAELRRSDDVSGRKREAAIVIDGWATDLIKILGKFGSVLRQHPDSIYKLVPPFCPQDSMVYRQFGRRESRVLRVSGSTSTISWDDCLARFSVPEGATAASVIVAGSRITVLSMKQSASQITLYDSAAFEEQQLIIHPERVFGIQASRLGDLIVSYGYATTRVWDSSTGACLKIISNPPNWPRPHSIIFSENQNSIVVCLSDRSIRSCTLDNNTDKWTHLSQIREEGVLDNTRVSFPACSALSPDGSMVAFGYRNHPLTVWELEPPILLGQCYRRLDETHKTIEEETWGEVTRVAWHPLTCEVFALTQVGLLFRWDPREEDVAASVQAGGHCLAINRDGSLVATGDGLGSIKVFATADFSLLYQLSAQDAVVSLTFSPDGRRLYDTRIGSYGNAWEPNALVRRADCPEYYSGNWEMKAATDTHGSPPPEHHAGQADPVITLAGQSLGPLYCYGTASGVAILAEVGKGKLCEIARHGGRIPMDHVAWSSDDTLVALADLAGRVLVKRVTRSNEHQATWRVSHDLFDAVIPPDEPETSTISQLIFHSTGKKLLVATSRQIFAVDLESSTLTRANIELLSDASPQMDATLNVKWARHPTDPDVLLCFGISELRVFTWSDFLATEAHSYQISQVQGSPTTPTVSAPPSPLAQGIRTRGGVATAAGQWNEGKVGRLIVTDGMPEILLEISSTNSSGHRETQHLLFDIRDLRLGGKDPHKTLSYTLLPPEVSARIREPLAVLYQRRLVFLDVDHWVCTWRLSDATSGPPVEPTDGTADIEQHYFLPTDWATGNHSRLCTVTSDGTLLCPRGGGVVTVQAARLRSQTC